MNALSNPHNFYNRFNQKKKKKIMKLSPSHQKPFVLFLSFFPEICSVLTYGLNVLVQQYKVQDTMFGNFIKFKKKESMKKMRKQDKKRLKCMIQGDFIRGMTLNE